MLVLSRQCSTRQLGWKCAAQKFIRRKAINHDAASRHFSTGNNAGKEVETDWQKKVSNFLSKFSNVSPPNEEWRSIQFAVRGRPWPTIVRKDIVSRALCHLGLPDDKVTNNVGKGAPAGASGPLNHNKRSTEGKLAAGKGEEKKATAGDQLVGSSRCVVLFGPRGIGKKTIAEHVFSREIVAQNFVIQRFNFQTVATCVFPVFLSEFFQFLKSALLHPDFELTVPLIKAAAFKRPTFETALENYTTDITNLKYPCQSFHRETEIMLMKKVLRNLNELKRSGTNGSNDGKEPGKGEYLFDGLVSTLGTVQEGTPATKTALQLLEAVGFYEENMLAFTRSDRKLSMYQTGDITLADLFRLCSMLNDSKPVGKKKILLFLEAIEVLSRSAHFQERGHPFLVNLMYNCSTKTSGIPVLATTDDSLVLLRLTDACPAEVPSALALLATTEQSEKVGAGSKPCTVAASGPHKILQKPFVVEVTPWTAYNVIELFQQFVSSQRKVASAAFECVGGLPLFLRRLADAIIAEDQRMQRELFASDLSLIHELKGMRDTVSQLDRDASAQEKIEEEQERRHQGVIRNALKDLLARDLLQIQWKIDMWLSLPVTQVLRRKSRVPIIYYVALLETVRLLLEKETLPVSDFGNIRNPVVLGLLDANILRFAFYPTHRIEWYDRLTWHALNGFIIEKFEKLSYSGKREYNAAALENSQFIRSRLQDLTLGWSDHDGLSRMRGRFALS